MNIPKQGQLSRRAVLRGFGAAISLPLLEAMGSAATASGAAVRLGYIYTPNGIVGATEKGPRPFTWTPRTTGENFEFSPTMKALEPYRRQLNVFSGLAQHLGMPLADGGGDHARANATFLTGARPFKTLGADFRLGISADQIAARALGKYTQLSSLEMALEPQPFAGACDTGYTCAYETMSWRGPSNPVPAEVSPRAVFERMFGDSDSTDSAVRMARLQNQKSVLDYVTASIARIGQRLGADDKHKLDEYTDSIRDVERRIQKTEEQNGQIELPRMERPSTIPADYFDYAKLMIDLFVLSWQSDVTRVSSLMLGRDGSNRPYRELDISEGHHSISHHRNNPEQLDRLVKINEMHTGLYAHLLGRLQETRDGEGSLLDHSLVLFGSGLSELNSHLHYDLPIVMAGSAGGRVKGNRHLVYPTDTPLNNLLLVMLDAAGVPRVDGFGDSTGRLTNV